MCYSNKADKKQILKAAARAAGVNGIEMMCGAEWEQMVTAVRVVENAGGKSPFAFPLKAVAVRAYQFSSEEEMVQVFERFRSETLGHQLVLTKDEFRNVAAPGTGATMLANDGHPHVSLEDYLPTLRAIPPGDERRIPHDIGGYKKPVCPKEGAGGTVVHTTCTGGTTFILCGRGFVSGVANHPTYLIILRHFDGFDEKFSVLGEPEIETVLEPEEGEV